MTEVTAISVDVSPVGESSTNTQTITRRTNYTNGLYSNGVAVLTSLSEASEDDAGLMPASSVALLSGLTDRGTYANNLSTTNGTTNAAALMVHIAARSTAGGGPVYIPPGTWPLDPNIVELPSNVWLEGVSHASILACVSAMNGTDWLISNANDTIADLTTRTDENLGVVNLTIDGSDAAYVDYPTAGYSSAGSLIRFRRVKNPFVTNCVFLDFRQGYAIRESGCLNARFKGNRFERCGKGDFSSGGISSTFYGSTRVIRSISKANPCVITFFTSHAFDIGNVYIKDVRGMIELTDGTYAVTATSATTITLGSVNSAAYSDYILDPNSRVTTTDCLESEGMVASHNKFEDMYRLAGQTSGIEGAFIDNIVEGAGEAGFYSLYGRRPRIQNNTISGVLMTDIVGSGIEVDFVDNPIVNGNHISRCEGNGIRAGGTIGGDFSGNQISELGLTAGLTFPTGPGSVAASLNGTAVPDTYRTGMIFINQDEFPCRSFYSAGCTFKEQRDGAAALMSSPYYIGKSGSSSMNGPFTIHRPNFTYYTRSGVTLIDTAATSINVGARYEYLHPTTGVLVSGDLDNTASDPRPAEFNQAVADVTGYSATTYLVGSNITVENKLKIGTRYQCIFDITKTAAGTALPVITVRFGTTATTGGSPSILSLTFPAQTAAIDAGVFTIDVTFRVVGASAVITAVGRLVHNLAATGLSTSNAPVIVGTSSTFDSSVAGSMIGIAVNGGASAAWTSTLVNAKLENLG
jgi:hypothetical protein